MTDRGAKNARIWLAGLFFASVAAGLTLVYLRETGAFHSGVRLPWWVLAALFALVEIHVVHVQFRRETQSFSLSEIPLVVGLFFATPVELVLAQLAGAAVALILYRRQPTLKWIYNLGQFCLSAVVASLVFRALAQTGGLLDAREIGAAFAASLAAIAVGTAAVILAITLAEGRPPAPLIGRSLVFGTLGTMTNTSLALMAVVLVRQDARTAWLLLVPAAVLLVAYRGYTSSRQHAETLATFTEATRTVQRSLELEPAMQSVLQRARELFHAEVAAALFLPLDSRESAMEARLGPDSGIEVLTSVDLDPTEGLWARVVAEGTGVALARPIENERLRDHFATQGIRDVMIVPLWGRDTPIGTMMVANRAGDVASFTAQDLSLFETYVGHVGLALENVRLVARLQQSVGDLTLLDRLKDESLSTLSHELRNPITSILNSIDLAQTEGLAPADRRENLQLIADQAQHLRSLLEDLLMDARLAGRAVEPVLAPIRTTELIERVVASCRPWARRHVLAVEVEHGIPTISSDPDILSRILCNLIGNAAKNSPSGTTIRISANRAGDVVRFSVSDDGVGIPIELHERIFERFVHYEALDGPFDRGTGLGLSICQRLAGVVGGRVWLVRSEPGRGSEFAVQVPIRWHASDPVRGAGEHAVLEPDGLERSDPPQPAPR